MRKDLKYIVILVLAASTYILLEVMTPDPIDWTITLFEKDKNPFGSFLVKERLSDIFQDVESSNLTLYEIQDSSYQSIFILSQNFSPSKEDIDVLLRNAESGSNILVAASFYNSLIMDTLGIKTVDYLFKDNVIENLEKSDTLAMRFTNPAINQESYYFQRNNAQYHFSYADSVKTTVLGVNDLDKPIFIKLKWGNGNIYLCSTPLAFTNNYMVYENNAQYVSRVLSYLPSSNIYWTAYYQLGRNEASTPLRFILSDEGLKWAYYTAILSLLIFMFFESKRKQRAIPIVKPPTNDTLEFVGTISNLYYQKSAHKSIAEKKINFFLDQIRIHTYINIHPHAPEFVSKIAHKTGNDEDEVKNLFVLINEIRNQNQVSEEQLILLNKKIEAFKLI